MASSANDRASSTVARAVIPASKAPAARRESLSFTGSRKEGLRPSRVARRNRLDQVARDAVNRFNRMFADRRIDRDQRPDGYQSRLDLADQRGALHARRHSADLLFEKTDQARLREQLRAIRRV